MFETVFTLWYSCDSQREGVANVIIDIRLEICPTEGTTKVRD